MRPALLLALVLAACAGRTQKDTAEPPPQMYPVQKGTETGSLIYSVVETVADPGWLKDSAIHGFCTVALVKGTQLDSPCQRVTVTAVDEKGKEAGKANVEQGKFRLKVPKGSSYTLKVAAPLYKVGSEERIGPVKPGETVDIRLTKK